MWISVSVYFAIYYFNAQVDLCNSDQTLCLRVQLKFHEFMVSIIKLRYYTG